MHLYCRLDWHDCDQGKYTCTSTGTADWTRTDCHQNKYTCTCSVDWIGTDCDQGKYICTRMAGWTRTAIVIRISARVQVLLTEVELMAIRVSTCGLVRVAGL